MLHRKSKIYSYLIVIISIVLTSFIKHLKSQQTGTISFGISENQNLYGSNFQIPILFNPSLIGQRNIQCLIQQFKTLEEYTSFRSSIVSSSTCSSSYNGKTSIQTTIASVNQLKNSPLTYDGSPFDWYFSDPSVNSTILFKIYNFTFQSSASNYLILNRYPLNALINDYTVYLSLFCCDPSYQSGQPISQSVYYSNVVSKFVVTVPANQNPNISLPYVPSNNDLLDPSYNPCTCNLTLNICDLNCCCDSDCSSSDISAFSVRCLNSTRQVISKEIDEYFCNDIYNHPKLNKSSWFPILCIHSATTVLLGKFYSPDPVTNLNSISHSADASYNIASMFLDSNSTQKDSSYCNTNNKVYRYGVCIQTTSNYLVSPSDFMRLPNAVGPFSACISDAPVRFLVDPGRSFCPIIINQASCSSSLISASSYIINGSIISNLTSQSTAAVNTEYWKCPYDVLFPSANPSSNTTLICNGTSFSSNANIFDSNLDNLCNNYNWSYSANRINNVPTDIYQNIDTSKCISVTSPDNPTSSGMLCNNTVVRIKNVFIWNNSTIIRILSRIILTDVDTNKVKTISPMFETKWFYQTNDNLNVASVTQYDQYISSISYINSLRSGVVGYINGLPLITGYKADVNDIKTPVNIDYNQRISTYSNDKLCSLSSRSERKLIKFNQNISSNCFIQLTNSDLTNTANCNNLRKIIFNKLNDYYAPSNLVSINGHPNMSVHNSSEWLKIYPSSRFLDLNDSSPDPYKCINIPYQMNVQFFYSTIGTINKTNVNQITGTYITYSLTNWTFVCKLDMASCNNANLVQNYMIKFQATFINTDNTSLTRLDQCKKNPDYSPSCIQQVFFIWPRDYNQPDYFLLYSNNLGLLFGVFGLLIIYVMIIGFVCPC